MNILRVCYEYPPTWDGLTPGPFEISLAQIEKGHKVIFLAGGNGNDPYVKEDGIEVKRIGKSLPTYLFGLFFYFDIKLIYYIWKILKTKKIDVIHFHGNTVLWFNVLKLLGFYKKIPYVFYAHKSGIKNFKTFWKKSNYLNKTKALFIWPLMVMQDFLTVKTANAIIAVSQSEKDIFIDDYKCPNEKIFIVENGVNVKRFASKKEKAGDILKIIFVGILRERKNIEKIFSVLKVLVEKGNAPFLTVVGRVDKKYISKLKSISRELDIDKKIIWKGYIPYPDLPNIYAKNDILLLLSHSEGLPKVILEAISCGLRVVSTRSFYVDGFLNEIVEWIDVEDDEEKVADKIIEALNKEIDFVRFRQEYSWSKKAEEIDKIYESLME